MFNKLGSAFTIQHWGPQKFFGGPHVARGPQFGHPWYRGLKIANIEAKLLLKA